MLGPGVHEDAALAALQRGEAGDAQVRAVLALAAAVNRLARAQEDLAGSACPEARVLAAVSGQLARSFP
jgi:hypothetical protein